MERALIIGASGGIGSALAVELAAGGVEVTGLSRSRDALDLTDEATIADGLGALVGPFDMVFVTTGALELDGRGPEKAISGVTAEALVAQFRLNAIGPMLVLKHALGLLPRDRRAVFAALSARVGSIGDNRLGGWHGYRASKAALNQLIHGAAIEMARTHPQAIAVCLHPGTVATRFTAKYAAGRQVVAPEEAARNLIGVVRALRPDQSGGFFDYSGAPVPW